MPESTQTNLVSFLELSPDECIPSRIVKALVLTLTLPSFTDPLPRIMILAPLWEENKTLDVIKLSLLLHSALICRTSLNTDPIHYSIVTKRDVKEAISLLMLCTLSNRWWPFSYHTKLVDFEDLMLCPFSHEKSWHKLRKVYWIWQLSSDSQINKLQRGCPKTSELPDVNINTGVQSIKSESFFISSSVGWVL